LTPALTQFGIAFSSARSPEINCMRIGFLVPSNLGGIDEFGNHVPSAILWPQFKHHVEPS